MGQTKGRGKLDRENRYASRVKVIFLYRLDNRFRETLRKVP